MRFIRELLLATGPLAGGLITWGILAIRERLPWLALFFDGSFWLCGLGLVLSLVTLTAMYANRIGHSRSSRAALSVSTLFLCIMAFPLMQQVDEQLQYFAQHDPERLVRRTLIAACQFLQTSMLVLTLGVAAIAVGLLANAFPGLPRESP
ncbi:hypothetical protein [Lysobacter sp.]|uniref:hypothetical protein n=1 Tax=Lysobacter sp. TaxID=72226 RepID=UPI002D5D527A|nr:hypothetical protein [Lysobacter sp.]HZX78201.1 hypothetical protein [Lysobacter sp.]